MDGARFFYHHKATVGAILRDENDNVVMAANKIENEVFDLETIDLIAML